MSKTVIKVLGSAQDGGVPVFNCNCENCTIARKNPEKRRYSACLGVILPEQRRWHLIDATPHINEQIEIVKTGFPEMELMDSILLTHAHIGHYTGLLYLGLEMGFANNVLVKAGKGMSNFLRNNVPWKQLIEHENIRLETIYSEESFLLDQGVVVTPLIVPHRDEYSETFGFIFTGQNKKLLYIPDIDRWEEWEKDIREIVEYVDYCLLDATFYSLNCTAKEGLDYNNIPHPLMTQAMDLLQEVADKKTSKIYFTHFTHVNPVYNRDSSIRDLVHERGFYIAEEGMEFLI